MKTLSAVGLGILLLIQAVDVASGTPGEQMRQSTEGREQKE